MSGSVILKLQAIYDFFVEDIRCIHRGENSYHSNHLNRCLYDNELNILKGNVAASMRNKNYDVEVFLNPDFSIQKATCTCPRGQFICHHMACVALYAHYNISKTDVPCKWVNKTSQVVEVKPVVPETAFDPLEGTSSSEESVAQFRHDLKNSGSCGMLWLMEPEPTLEQATLIVNVEDILISEEYCTSSNKEKVLQEKLQLSFEKICEIADKTKGQVNNPAWLIARKHRLTASVFGDIIRSHKRNRYPPSLFKKLTGSYDVDRVKAIQWGRQNEENAIKQFESKTGMTVQKTGVWLDSCGFIGASPDGLVGEDSLVEVKCPYKYRNDKLKDVLRPTDVIFWENDNYTVNTDHSYYHQIQGQLYCTNRQCCYLVIYTSNDMVIVKILKCDSWGVNVDILKKFYLNHYVKYITD